MRRAGRTSGLKKIAMDSLKEETTWEFEKDNTFLSLISPDKIKKISGSKASEEIKENYIEEVCLGSPILLVESGEEGGEEEEEEEKGEERQKSCAEQNSATEKPEEECELEEFFDLSSVSWVSISRKKQKPQKKRTSALFEENRIAQQHKKRRKNKRELEKTVMPVQELNLRSCDVCKRSFDGFQNASRIKQEMAVENDKSQLVSSFVTSQETRKQMHSKNKYKDLAEIHHRTCLISRNQAKDHIPLLEAEQMLSVQIQPVEITKQSSSRNKLTTATKVQDEKQESSVLALPLKDCTQSKNTDIYSDDSVSMSCFVPVAQQSCHNILDKKLLLPFKKQSGTQKKKKRSPAGPMRKKNGQLVSKGSLEDDRGEEQLDKKENLHPFKLRTELKRAKPQKVKETSLPKSQNNVLYQEDSCEQHVTKKNLNVSVTPQNNEGFLSQSSASDETMNNISDRLLPPLCSNEMFRRKLNPYNTNGSDSVLPTNTHNLRRSKRIRIKPLEYWRGERVYYKINSSGGFVVGGIISPEQRETRKPKAKVVTKSVPEIENLDINLTFKEHFPQPAVVFDKTSNQEILQECVHNGSSSVFCVSNEILTIYKYLNTPSFTTGKLILNPLKEKGYQYTHTDTLIFHICHGKLLLMLHDQSYYLTDGNYFFIPPGNIYNIRNLLNKECVILFTQLKGKERLDN